VEALAVLDVLVGLADGVAAKASTGTPAEAFAEALAFLRLILMGTRPSSCERAGGVSKSPTALSSTRLLRFRLRCFCASRAAWCGSSAGFKCSLSGFLECNAGVLEEGCGRSELLFLGFFEGLASAESDKAAAWDQNQHVSTPAATEPSLP
jgi:hypothetical protein